MADKKKAAARPAAKSARKPASPERKAATPRPTVEPKKTTAAAARRTGKAAARTPRARSKATVEAPPKPAAAVKKPAKARALSPRRREAAKKPAAPDVAAAAAPGLSEEDTIRSAKYLPRNLPPRLFEEERFLFPESYGIDRVRLLVRDPEWLFAYWDVSPKSVENLRRQLGERAAAVARLTLRMADPVSGGASDILLPPGARWWYVRADSARRSYRAELGFTLASGEFRTLAKSNTVTTPRVGPSSEPAKRRLSYKQAGEIPPAAGAAVRQDEASVAASNEPWSAPNVDGTTEPSDPSSAASSRGDRAARKGGASDAFRPGGASDVHRR
jgi:hypothetical protein